ncbi:MAG: cytoplasmic protein [Rhodospirillaceae bacterium]|nr:cytoplasmic protein [Rhodospirillaceae bacterium]|tara:strand:- start:1026 stop:1631 length:606 start_codon:yes stop_codon:yes gene_type:complete
MGQLLMPQATAVWLVDNTTLTFKQIANFCDMHELEIQGIADGEVAINIVGQDPVLSGQLEADELNRCLADPHANLQLRKRMDLPKVKVSKARYTPVAKRQDKPNAILYLIKRFPQLADAQVVRLIGTTKQTITQVREGTHRNSEELEAKDPVLLGLCNAKDLNVEIEKANAKAATLEKNLANARAELAAREDEEEKAIGEV